MIPLTERSANPVDVTTTPLGALLPAAADPALAHAAWQIVDDVVKGDVRVQGQMDADDGDYSTSRPPHLAR